MKIGFIGAGNIGANAARLFAAAGHEVAISNSRGPETLADLAAEIGGTALEAEKIAAFADVVFISVPFGKYTEVPSGGLDGKIVIDSNNYYSDRDGNYIAIDNGSTTSSELLAEHLSGARVVKAFNTIWYEHLRTQGDATKPLEERRVIFLSGDDAEARSTVATLIAQIGFAPYDLGDLAEGGRRQQPDAAVYNKTLTIAEADSVLSSAESNAATGA